MAPLRFKLIKDIKKLDGEIIKHIFNNFGAIIDGWDSPKYYIIVVYDKKDWVAYSCLRHHENHNDGNICYSGPVFVKSAYRGKGLQANLLKRKIRLAKKLGYVRMVSSTYIENYPSNNSLIKCGFRMIAPWLQGEPDSIYWEKVL